MQINYLKINQLYLLWNGIPLWLVQMFEIQFNINLLLLFWTVNTLQKFTIGIVLPLGAWAVY